MSRTTLRATVLGGAALFVAALAGPAFAHVTISPGDAAKGDSDVEVTFRVPDEEDSATTQLEVVFPTDHPITGVLPEPMPGWTAKVENLTLPTPIKTDDGTVTQVVSKITWTGGPLAAGRYQGFHVLLGHVPDDAEQVTFKALQTYANGDVVRWIDVRQAGQPEPDHPAPVLKLTAASGGDSAAPSSSASGGSPVPSVTTTAPASGTTSATAKSDSTARALGIAGLVVGALGLIAGGLGFAAARRNAAGEPS
ncbi:MAG: YcnI family protein [Catenulispora sp.]